MTHIPMTRPNEMIAEHHLSQGHSTTWVQFDSGRIFMAGAGKFYCSDDGGVTWSEPYTGQAEGESGNITLLSMVKLDGDVIGGTFAKKTGASTNRYGNHLYFCQSSDEGHTWSKPTLINHDISAVCQQDTLLRTKSGRLLCPAYASLGQGMFHELGKPFVGGYVNGQFVSTDAHFYDPHFSVTNVYFSDDLGQTWQRNVDGDIFIVLDNGHYQSCAEPSICQVSSNKLMMLMRTRLGRLYQAWSSDDGSTWTRPQATQLASTQVPAQIRTLFNGHLLCVFTQQSADEIRRGFIRTRLSSAISRLEGNVWEYFQNIESIHEQTHVEPGPIEVVRPAGGYPMYASDAFENDTQYVQPLPVGWGRWSYPSVLALEDRVLIAHTYSYVDQTGKMADLGYNCKIKVLPLSWFYNGQISAENPTLAKLGEAAKP